MKNLNTVAAVVFALGLAAVVGFELTSEDYEFAPLRSTAASGNRPRSPAGEPIGEPSQETIAKYARTSGALDPGNAEVNVIFLNPIRNLRADSLFFQVAINTNSLDMSGFDITQEAAVEYEDGASIMDGFEWRPIHNSHNHHFMGILTVPGLKTGKAIFKEAKYIKLIIKGIPSIDKREFRWSDSLG